ncbi:MAG: peptidylprolyl isomerase [Bryobacteraceae bacterium]
MSFRFPARWAVLWLCAAGWAQTGTELVPQAAVEPGLYATIHTSMGDIKVRLFEKEAPLTVENFVALARGEKEYKDPRTGEMSKKPLYDGLTFHRVIPGFMIQGGDPLGDGTGGTEPIPDEFVEDLQFDVPGRLAMANSGPDSGSCQFFVTEVPTPHLNGRHTIFGQVVEGQELVAEIARVWRDEEDKPLADVHIHTIRIERVEAPKQASAAK